MTKLSKVREGEHRSEGGRREEVKVTSGSE